MPWRLLEEEKKDVIRMGDENWSNIWTNWKPVPEDWYGLPVTEESFTPIRRRFTQEEPQQVVLTGLTGA